MISYVDKIVQMRRNLVMIKGEFPHELQKPFKGMETNGNPWNLSRIDRASWADGLEHPDVRARSPTPRCCTGSAAPRATTTAPRRSRARPRELLKQAGVDFAILGEEETCTGDPARRAGNEYLFPMLAERTSRRSTATRSRAA